MAEANGSLVTPGITDTASSGLLLMSGEVFYKGRAHHLYLRQSGLQLVKSHISQKAKSTDLVVLDVNWRWVMCGCVSPVKKSKSSPNHSDSESLDDSRNNKNLFIIHYSVKNSKTNKVQCKNITLETKAGNAAHWVSLIEEKRKEGKPKRLLVVINPIGGKGTARQTFEKRVQPLLSLAGIHLVVKVTERAKHAVEIAKTFDTASVDGVIVVGGDGLYMEVLHGLVLRKQEEEGVDFNNPDVALRSPTVNIGIIPAGTGNGVSGWLNGVIDVDTAALNIVRGETRPTNIFSIHESQRLLHYSGLLLANGFFSQMIQRTDELRWMKRARYPYAAMSSLVKRKQVLEFDVEVLKNEAEPVKEDIEPSPRGAEAQSGWIKLGTKRLIATMSFIAKILVNGEKLELHPFYPGFDLLLIDKSSALDNFGLILSFVTRNKNALEKDYLEVVRDIRGARFHMVEATDSTNTRHHDQVRELCKLLDVDGEIMHLSSPSFEVRLHPQLLPVYCAPELYSVVPL